MKTICPVCNNSANEFTIPVSSDGSWKMYKCKTCKTHFQYPNKQSKELYNSEYFRGLGSDKLINYTKISKAEIFQAKFKVKYLTSIFERLNGKKHEKLDFLDIGPGNGSVVLEAQNLFYTSAYDITKGNINIIRKAGYRDKFKLVDLERNNMKNHEKFDLIHISEVVEHLSNPTIFFKNISKLLKEGGVIFIQTGRSDSLTSYLAGKSWTYYRLVHSIIYSKKSIEYLLENNSFKIVKFQGDFENAAEVYRILKINKNIIYILVYMLRKLIPNFGRMQIISIKI